MKKLLKIYAVLAASCMGPNANAEEVCVVDNTPSRIFDAKADYQSIGNGTFAIYVYLEGKKAEYTSQLEIYYGVPGDFTWNEDERLGERFEFSSIIQMEIDGNQRESELVLNRNFKNFYLLLTIQQNLDATNFCPKNLGLLVNKNQLKHSSSVQKLGDFFVLP